VGQETDGPGLYYYLQSRTNYLGANALSRAPCHTGKESDDSSVGRIVGELLLVDDGSVQVRLEFSLELTFLESQHKCVKCVKVPNIASVRIPQGSRRPVVSSRFTTVREARLSDNRCRVSRGTRTGS
jgi:hypothetical protein